MSWLLPDPPPIVVVRDWERTFEQWLAKLGWLVPGGLSLDLIGADATFDAFQDGVSAADYAAVLRGLKPHPPKPEARIRRNSRVSYWATAERRALSLLAHGPLVRRLRGWRFGTASVPDRVVNRLLSTGKASLVGGEIQLAVLHRASVG